MMSLLFFFILSITLWNFPGSAFAQDACLPFSMPPKDTILSSNKMVLAHYFNRLPLSIDNRPAAWDYYTKQYLNPYGENNKWRDNGGYLRTRPLRVLPKAGNYQAENLKKEIELAIARGINGFTFNILSLEDLEDGSYLDNILTAASNIDPRFKIVLMPDMSAFKGNTDKVKQVIKKTYHKKGVYHFPDGRLVIAPFLSEAVPYDKWETIQKELKREGFNVAFIFTFLSAKQNYVERYLPISAGIGTFGTPLPNMGKHQIDAINQTMRHNKLYLAGISPQGYRPKSYIFWESQGSFAYRETWKDIIQSNANGVQLTTWNDFSETTQIAPYTDRYNSSGTGFYNLTGYYASWFLTGNQPEITHDVLYYFYRKQSISTLSPKAGEKTKSSHPHLSGNDKIELLGFLTDPATLKIKIGSNEYTKDVDKGVQSFTVALENGYPEFSLIRKGNALISFSGNTKIDTIKTTPSGYADLTYWSGSASATKTCFTNDLENNS